MLECKFQKLADGSPFQVQFTDISEGGITGRTWYRNGTSFSNLLNPQIVLTNTSGTVRYDTIMMVARKTGTFTCYDTAKRIIAIYPEVDPSFNHLITEGCSPLTVEFHTCSKFIRILLGIWR
jgi:PKD repeat protein